MRVRIYGEVAKPLQEEPIGFTWAHHLFTFGLTAFPSSRLVSVPTCSHAYIFIHALPTCVNASRTLAQQEYKAVIKVFLDVAKLLSKEAIKIVSAHLPITLNQLLNICQIFQVEDGISLF